MTKQSWQDWLAAFPDRPDLAVDPYRYARSVSRAFERALPPFSELDLATRIIVTSMLQNVVIDLLRIQHFSVPNTAPSAVMIALANFFALLYPAVLPYCLIAQVMIALWLVGQEQQMRDLKRATDAAQSAVDELLASLPKVGR